VHRKLLGDIAPIANDLSTFTFGFAEAIFIKYFGDLTAALVGRRWYGHRLEDEAMTRRESPASSGDGQVRLRIADAVAHVLFDRPWARNAMTWAMYDGSPQPVPRLTKIAVSASLSSAALGARLLSPALILRSSASSPMGMMALPTKQGSTALSTR
jgi:hypothetical protein